MPISEKLRRESFSCSSRADLTALPDLTPGERRVLIENVIGRRFDGRLEGELRAAVSRAKAVEHLRNQRRYQGSSGPGGLSHSGHKDGILAWIEEWEIDPEHAGEHPRYRFVRGMRASFIPYGEIADFVRTGAEVAVQAAFILDGAASKAVD